MCVGRQLTSIYIHLSFLWLVARLFNCSLLDIHYVHSPSLKGPTYKSTFVMVTLYCVGSHVVCLEQDDVHC